MTIRGVIGAWETAEPVDVGFRAGMAEKLDRLFAAGELPNLHAAAVIRRGSVVLERYYSGPDQRWGTPLGIVQQQPELRHDLRSVSKSIVGLLYGIALSEGKVPATSARLVDLFPAYADLAADPQRRRMTVAHALSMRLGTEWNEDIPYSDPANSERAMEAAADRYRFILDRPMAAKPGTKWTYNGGATAVLAHLIARGTETPLLAYARQKLFSPLGVEDVEWVTGSNGEPAAASGLRMRLLDLARLGQLVLNGGAWGDRQLVPRAWLRTSFKVRAQAEPGLDYGYQWWLGRLLDGGKPWVAGFGNGGQRLWVIPSLDLIVTVFAGNYNAPDQWKVPLAVMSRVVIPALAR